jgi:two-component system, sensor histidine kinase PdtaS
MATDSVSDYIQNLNAGNHISCIYRSDKELLSVLVPFFTVGLERRNKCLFTIGIKTQNQIIDTFKEAGVDLSSYVQRGDFVFIKNEDLYLKDGEFNESGVFGLLKNAEADALKQGYSGLFVSGEASWLIENPSAEANFIKYEAAINDFLQNSTIKTLCLYNEIIYGEHTLIEVLRTHPVVYLYDHFVTNKYFAPEENFLPLKKDESDSGKYQKLIASLS